MKKIIILSTICLLAAGTSFAQGNGNGNGNNGNAFGNNGNGNGNGNNGNGNGNGGSNQGVGGGSSAGAGEASSAAQATNLALNNAIEITFVGNSSEVGADVTIPFTTVNDYANGVASDEQELKIRSNKNFSVAVKTSSANFSYTGSTTPAPAMPVSGVLGIKVTDNSTGGSIANPFSSTAFATLTNTNQNLIAAANRGGNQTFSVQYKATPGFAYPAGTYAVDVVYTATQQ